MRLNERLRSLHTVYHRLQQTHAQLQEQRAWLVHTLTSIGDAVLATDPQGRVTLMNPVAEALTGWPAPEAPGRPVTEIFPIVNMYTRQPVDDPVTRVLREGARVGLCNQTLLLARDGTALPRVHHRSCMVLQPRDGVHCRAAMTVPAPAWGGQRVARRPAAVFGWRHPRGEHDSVAQQEVSCGRERMEPATMSYAQLQAAYEALQEQVIAQAGVAALQQWTPVWEETPPPTVRPHETRRVLEDGLAGGGQMGARIRAFDWATTPLGPVTQWPQSLLTAVSICQASRFPIVIYWGAEYVTVYNDAYSEILARKHPWALGRTAREVWAEIWDVIGPMLDSVCVTGHATWSDDLLLLLERQGYPEECYFSFSFSPIRGEYGRIGGVFTAVTETTQRVLGERRLRTLRDLAAGAGEAKSGEEACHRAATCLAGNPADLPFTLLYLCDAEGTQAELVGCTGLAPDTPASPRRVDLTAVAPQPWPLGRVARTAQAEIVPDLAERFGPLPGGPWPESPHTALILPVAAATPGPLAGLFVAGVSPRRAFDDDYYSFLTLVAGYIATAMAHARAYEEERKRAEALAELDRAKTAFFSNISHEFRTPLTLMLGPVEDLLSTPAPPVMPEHRELLTVVQRNGLRLQKLVNTLLDFSRIEAGRMEARYEPTDLAACTADLASVFRSACERAGLRLVVDCPPLPEAVYVDRDMWEKIVLNLLSNAFKFTFAGEIAVCLTWGGAHVALAVRDTGTGIPVHELPHIFERFHRVRDARARTHEGTGIGLALVQELVRLHGGQITVVSEVGVSTTFTVTLPTGTAHLPADRVGMPRTLASTTLGADAYVQEALHWLPGAPERPSAVEVPFPHTSGSPRPSAPPAARILLADDNADMRAYVQRLLSPHWEVEAVADGAQALAVAGARVPDLVVADVMMPGLDGFALLHALRADPRTATIPVLLLSARAGEESRVEGLEAGADDYLIKPFTARELLARVEAHLKLKALREETQATVRASAARFRALVEASAQIVWTADADGAVVDDSPSWRAFTGQTSAEWQGWGWLDALHPDDRARVAAWWREAVAQRTLVDTEYRLRHVSGAWRWMAVRAVPLRASDGAVHGWVGMNTDITERRRAEEALRQREAALRESQDHITRLNAHLRADLARMTRLQHVSTQLVQAGDVSALLYEILDAAIAMTGADMGNMQLLDGNALKIVAQRGFDAPFLAFFNAVHEGLAACGTAMQRGERVIVDDVATSPLFAGSPACDVMLAAQARAVQSTPLLTRTGRMLGMFSTHYRVPQRPTEGELRLLDVLARQAADFIERAQAEQARAQLAAIVTSSDDAIMSTDLDGIITSWNQSAERLFGYTAAEAVGQPISMLTSPDRLDEEPRILDRLKRGERVDSFETIRMRKDGSRLDIALTSSPVKDAEGRIIGASQVARDITARLRTEQALRASEERFRRLVALLPAAVYTCDAPSGRVTFYNDQAAMLWGRAPRLGDTDERFCGSFKLWRPDGTPLPHDETPMAVAVRDGRAFHNQEVVIERPDGTRITVLVNIDPVYDDAGRLVGAINVFHDTTALKQAEQALRDSERRFRDMIDALPAAIYTTDAEGRLTHVNPAAVELSGRVPELGTDQWCVSWKLYDPDGTPMPPAAWPVAMALTEGRAVRGAEAMVERPDGRRIWFEPYPTPLRNSAGQVVGGINMLVDITERKRAEEVLRRSERFVHWQKQALERLVEGVPLREVLASLVRAIQEQSRQNMLAAIHLLSAAGTHFAEAIAPDLPPSYCQATTGMAVASKTGPCCYAVLHGTPVVASDITADAQWSAFAAFAQPLGIGAAWSAPIVAATGRMLGTFACYYPEPGTPSPQDVQAVEVLTRTVVLAIERQQAEAALRYAAAQHETLLNQAPLGVYLVDADLRIREVNPTALAVFGDIPDLIGQDFDEVIHRLWTQEYADEIVRIFRHTLETGEPYATPERAEYRLDRGVTEYYEWRIDRIPLPEGRDGVVCYFRDISAQVLARQAIAASEARYRELAASLDQRVQERTALLALIQDITRAANEAPSSAAALQYAVDRFCAATGWPVGHVYLAAPGADGWEPTTIWHLDAPERFTAFQQATYGLGVTAGEGLVGRVGASAHPEWQCEVATDPTFQRRQAAQEAGLRTGVAWPLLVGNEVAGVLECYTPEPLAPNSALLEAVTQIGTQLGRAIERERAAVQAQRQHEALFQREKLAAMSTMLASVAHELNNPLAIILMQADLVREEAGSGPLAETAAELTRAATRCERLVRTFLTLARQHAPERTTVELNTLVTETIDLLTPMLRVDTIAVELRLASALPRLCADPHQLQQVLVNLVTNAQQALREVATPRQLTLITRCDPARAVVTLEVTDTGPGIPPAIQTRIFEPFFTTKPPGVGTGLGLSLCQGVIEGHGGTISLHSMPGQGTTFHIEFPVGVVADVAAHRASPDAAPPPTAGGTILLVDDEEGIAKAVPRLLRRDGHTVDTAANGRLALAKLQERPYDLILCDLRMPELDGPGLYRTLAQDAPHLCRRFLFLTGDTLSPEIQQFLEQSGVPRLTKPFTAAAVRHAVAQALRAV